MKTTIVLAVLLAALLMSLFFLTESFRQPPDRIERHRIGEIDATHTVMLNNAACVEIIPSDHLVTVEYMGYNVRTGNAFKPPFVEVRLDDGTRSYLISTHGTGNNRLKVDGVMYEVKNLKQIMTIRFPADPTVNPYQIDPDVPMVSQAEFMRDAKE